LTAIQNEEITEGLKLRVNNPVNFKRLKGIIKANDEKHLLKLIKIGQYLLGNDGNFNWIDTSEITDMSALFSGNDDFNGDISMWDVSNVEDMSYMFHNASSFNQPIGDWDVSNVTFMQWMFKHAEAFN